MPDFKKILANAISGEQKQYLEDISVANIFPDKPDELKPNGIKKMRTMINDTGISLVLPTLFSGSQRTIKNEFVSFRKKFQVSSRLAEKDLSLAQKTEEANKAILGKLPGLEAEMISLESKFGSAKEKAEQLSAEFSTREDPVKSKEVTELEALKAKFKKAKREKALTINAKIKEVEDKIAAEEIKQKQAAKAILEAYAGKDEKKKKELLDGKYSWGPLTKSDKAVQAKRAYLLYYGKLDEWKEATFKDELRFLKEPEKFNSGEFKDFHRELSSIDSQLEEMQDRMNELQKTIEKADADKAKVRQNILKLEGYKEEIKKYMNLKNGYDLMVLKVSKELKSEKIYFKSVKSDAERICEHIETFLKVYKPELALKKKIDTAKGNGTISAEDSKGGTIPLILVVAKCYYFFNKLVENCERKIVALETEIKELQKKLSQNKLIAKHKKGSVISLKAK